MLWGKGTGPLGQGPGGGRGFKGGQGRGRGFGRGNQPGAGPGGFCICPNCKVKIPHKAGIPCYSVNCPQCGTPMVRA